MFICFPFFSTTVPIDTNKTDIPPKELDTLKINLLPWVKKKIDNQIKYTQVWRVLKR